MRAPRKFLSFIVSKTLVKFSRHREAKWLVNTENEMLKEENYRFNDFLSNNKKVSFQKQFPQTLEPFANLY